MDPSLIRFSYETSKPGESVNGNIDATVYVKINKSCFLILDLFHISEYSLS